MENLYLNFHTFNANWRWLIRLNITKRPAALLKVEAPHFSGQLERIRADTQRADINEAGRYQT